MKEVRGGRIQNSQEIVDKFTKNLNKAYQEEEKIEIIGRKKEIRAIVYVLSRLIKNNLLLIGHPGVGKTAVVEGLVQQIEKKEVPQYLLNKKIFQLDIMALIAGTRLQGDLEERLKIILEYMAKPENNAILFIDEIHSIISSSSGRIPGLDISNLLKPMLSRGEIQCIGATTFEEYYQHIEKDGAFIRRFSIVHVNEPDLQETRQILQEVAVYLETYYKLSVSLEALQATLDFSSRYLTNKFFPDKAIDLLDETCARVRSEMWYQPEVIGIAKKNLEKLEEEKNFLEVQNDAASLWFWKQKIEKQRRTLQQLILQDESEKSLIQEINLVQEELEQLESNLKVFQQAQDYVQASKIKYETIPLVKQRVQQLEGQAERNIFRNYLVKKDQIALTVAQKYGLNVEQISLNERKRLLNLLSVFQERIKGQDRVLRTVFDAVIRSWAGVQDPKKPLASFFFVGPTGVGKTEVALTIAEQLFGASNIFWRFDMSEFSEPHSISKFLGSPPGYAGFEQVSRFERLREKMSNLILFDEIEKCHPEVINLFLQILDNGILRLSNGKEVNFRNSIIIFTSNLASEVFFDSDEEDSEEKEDQEIEKKVKQTLKDFFRPEFLNRLDEIVCFRKLDEKVIRKIIVKELVSYLSFIEKEKKVSLSWSSELIDKIFREAYEKEYGARPIKRYIERRIGTLIGKYWNFNVIKTDGIYLIEVDKKTDDFKITLASPLENENSEKLRLQKLNEVFDEK